MQKIILISLLVLLINCQKKVIELPDKYQPFLNLTYELIEIKKTCKTDSAYLDSSSSLYVKYQITQEDYNKTLSFFENHPEQWHLFFKKLEQMQQDSSISQLN